MPIKPDDLRVSQLHPRLLNVAGLQQLSPPIVATISGVRTMRMRDGEKLVLSFEEDVDDLVLNRTNSLRLANAYGDACRTWVGHQITLSVEETEMNGQTVLGVRVAAEQSPPPRAEAPPHTPHARGVPPAPRRQIPRPADDEY